jgi:hypothetical protein
MTIMVMDRGRRPLPLLAREEERQIPNPSRRGETNLKSQRVLKDGMLFHCSLIHYPLRPRTLIVHRE